MQYRTSIVSIQGRRPQMEDAHFLDINFGGQGWIFGGVYDGHNGSYAAQYAAANLHKRFLEKVLAKVSPEQAFAETYQEISNELNGQSSGTVAATFMIRDYEIVTANTGDSRVIVVGEQRAIQLTTDHRPGNQQERERLLSIGSQSWRSYVSIGGMGKMATRSIGDENSKIGVIATPSVYRYRISGDDLALVAACDGVFDFISNEEVAEIARKYRDPTRMVDVLKDEVLGVRAGSDNLTVMVVSLK